MSLRGTSSQTVGPFYAIGLNWLNRTELADPGVQGEHISFEGRVLDGDGKPVPDALLEVWQANSQGKYAHPEDDQKKPVEPGFRGFGRVPVDDDGRFSFTTIKPGPVPGPDDRLQAPHIAVTVLARGLLRRLVTRIYFPGEPANETDFALGLVEPARRGTLIAKKIGEEAGRYEWNVILQGPGETVFFDC
jgi:protocatechuate 3,4-dioxygenase alpha subunit